VPGNAPLVVWRGKRNQENAVFVQARLPSLRATKLAAKLPA
jgi:hypothetical protein